MTLTEESRIIDALVGHQWLFTRRTVQTLYDEIMALREYVERLEDKILESAKV